MAKLKHRIRRDGGIKVRDAWYDIDASGCVEVSEEHASILLQGAMWTRVGVSPAPPRPQPPPIEVPPPAPEPSPETTPKATLKGHAEEEDLQRMERSELLGLARSLGVEVDGRWGKLKLTTMIRRARKGSKHE